MEADYSNIDGLALFQTGQLIQLKRIQLQKLCKSCGLNAGGKVGECSWVDTIYLQNRMLKWLTG